ncbi:hypothetical protein Enr17x_41300 [Gimesia fumaroli]|uniref:Uncharacterized protein n=1 Tax=Gimesia fumaroli TaxID=2527976 RepID=A0A518IG55_9PLAN|nr:hypothetical protein Enr17x_41300 [Gimesia fumaroli]
MRKDCFDFPEAQEVDEHLRFNKYRFIKALYLSITVKVTLHPTFFKFSENFVKKTSQQQLGILTSLRILG